MRTIAIVILHYSNAQDTLECILSLEKVIIPKSLQLQIIVVDNASPNEFKTTNKHVEVIRSKQNRGFTGGNNMGISYALSEGADFVIILNNDTTVDKHLAEEFLNAYEEFPQAALFAPKIYFSKGSEYHKSRYKTDQLGKVIWYAGGSIDWQDVAGRHIGVDQVDQGQFDTQVTIDFASGCCMCIPKQTFEKIGLFDEKYFLYYEDADLCLRIKKVGLQMIFVPKSILWHKNASSTGIGSTLQDYYISRNRMLFGMRYAPLRTKVALLKESMRLITNGRRWQKQGIADYYLGRFGKGSYKTL